MTTPMLTEAECEQLRMYADQFRPDGPVFDSLRGTVEAILAARLAPVEAERGRWQDRCQRTGQALTQALSERDATSRVLPCDGGCTDYAEECCSLHGRTPADLWQMLAEQHARAEAAERALARVQALPKAWEGIAEDVVNQSRASLYRQHASEVRAALDGPAPQPDEPIDLCAALQRSIDAAKASTTPPTADAEEA